MATNSTPQLNANVHFPRDRIRLSWISVSPGWFSPLRCPGFWAKRAAFLFAVLGLALSTGRRNSGCAPREERHGGPRTNDNSCLPPSFPPGLADACHAREIPPLLPFIFVSSPPQKLNDALERIPVGFQVWLKPWVPWDGGQVISPLGTLLFFPVK